MYNVSRLRLTAFFTCLGFVLLSVPGVCAEEQADAAKEIVQWNDVSSIGYESYLKRQGYYSAYERVKMADARSYGKSAPSSQGSGWHDPSMQKFGVSVYGAAYLPENNSLGETVLVGGRLTYDVLPQLALGVDAGWGQFEDETDGVKFGEVNAFPLLAIAQLKFPMMEDRVVPYVLGGAGVVFWQYDESSLTKALGLSVGNDTSFAAKAGGGVEYYVSDAVALFAEGSYMWNEYDIKISGVGGVVRGTVETDSVFGGGGVKYRF